MYVCIEDLSALKTLSICMYCHVIGVIVYVACDSESTVHGGLVVRTHGERFLDIAQHPSNLLDTYVPVSSVKYTSAPLLAFWSDARNAHHDGRNTAGLLYSHHMHVSMYVCIYRILFVIIFIIFFVIHS